MRTTANELPQLLKDRRTTVPRLLYPALIVAAVSVTLVSLLGIAGITGYLPAAIANGPVVANGGQGQAPVSRKTAADSQPAVAQCAACGVVESVQAVETRGAGSGLGAVLGGVAGAVLGNTMGSGNGKTAMTLIGGGAGAYAGNEIEKNSKRQVVWQTRVRMDDGSVRKFSSPTQPEMTVGARVRLVNGQLVPST